MGPSTPVPLRRVPHPATPAINEWLEQQAEPEEEAEPPAEASMIEGETEGAPGVR